MNEIARDSRPHWRAHLPLDEFNLPPFPVEVLTPWVRDFVKAEAGFTETPPDLAAMLVLSVLSQAVAGRVAVQVRPGQVESLSLYTLTALRSGTRKSAVFADVLGPLRAFEREVGKTEKLVLDEERARLECLRHERDSLQSRLAKSEPKAEQDEARLKAVIHALASSNEPVPLRLYAEDATPEELTTQLALQGGAIGVFSPEGGGIFEILAGRYSANRVPNFEVFLKGHSGEPLRVNRRGRAEYVERAVLSMGLAAQPYALERLASHPAMRERGMCGRLLYAVPPDQLGTRTATGPMVPGNVADAYRNGVWRLLAGVQEVRRKTTGQPETIALSPTAHRVWHEFFAWVEPQLREDGALGWLTDWGGKLAGAVARIAGLLAVADAGNIETARGRPIDSDVVDRARHIGRYLVPHAKAAFHAMEQDPDQQRAQKLIRWIRAQGHSQFSRRDAYQALKGSVKKAVGIDGALEVLEAHLVIRAAEMPPKEGPGAPRSQLFDVNPSVFQSPPGRPGWNGRADSEDPGDRFQRAPRVGGPRHAG